MGFLSKVIKFKYYVEVKHIVDDYKISFTKSIRDKRELERLYSTRNLKVFIRLPSNITIDEYIGLMKLNKNLIVNHTLGELFAMDFDELKKLYDINNYTVSYSQYPNELYNKGYFINVTNNIYSKKRGRYIFKKKKNTVMKFDGFYDFIYNLSKIVEVTDDYTVLVDEEDIKYSEYRIFLNVNSLGFHIPEIIENKEDLITYIRDLAAIRKLI